MEVFSLLKYWKGGGVTGNNESTIPGTTTISTTLFTRENSSRSFGSKLQKQNSDEATTEDKRFPKDVVNKYLKMIKPLYVKASRRYGEKLKFSGQLSLGSGKTEATAPTTTMMPVTSLKPTKNNHGETEDSEVQSNGRSQKQGNLPSGLRVVCMRLRKSRSASSAVAAVPTLPFQARGKRVAGR